MKRPAMVVNALLAAAGLSTLLLAGCTRTEPLPPPARSVAPASLLMPESMRIHPTFTRVTDGVAPGTARGIEAELEFADSQQEPVKAEGRVFFELFAYRRDAPDPRGARVINPWVGSLTTDAEQRARWNRTTRTYTFRLNYPEIRTDKFYVLTATFEPVAGKRLFNRLILVPAEKPKDKAKPTSLPFGG
jgi:hypothetical protein